MFLAFAFAYFFSALLRAVTATLAPVFSDELRLSAGELGLLAGAYFLGFSAMQLPLGSALDRHGPKRVLLVLLSVAVIGCAAFAASTSFVHLLLARLLIGLGVSACLMAPLTCYRHHLGQAAQLRTNSWMLMTGSLGMLSSTLPVQWLLPVLGWRGLFAAVAGLLLLAMVLIHALVPADGARSPAPAPATSGYRDVFMHPVFVRMAPLAFFCYGGLLALQSLWIGPWLTQVAQLSAGDAARGLFAVNLSMLLAFLGWGLVMPRLVHAGWTAERIIGRAWPLGVLCLGLIIGLGPAAGAWGWALWCVLTSVVSLSQPAVGQAFPPALAGRALSAFNLVIFAGVFALQWGIGLLIDGLRLAGWSPVVAFRTTFGLLLLCCLVSFLWLRWYGASRGDTTRATAASS
ncbi:MFS transporter [Aquabacterium sp.]|uniref:MFS transporter n=1 Tax=Aquabacterium sp. TaxID=1872578 RepID=UPI0039C8B2BF